MLEVEGQAALVGVEGEVEEAVGVGPVAMRLAGDVAAVGLLDLDHVGAEPCEHLAAGGTGLVVGDVDHPDAGERLGHESRQSFTDASRGAGWSTWLRAAVACPACPHESRQPGTPLLPCLKRAAVAARQPELTESGADIPEGECDTGRGR